jgi:two-component system OmpR family sensor kinase
MTLRGRLTVWYTSVLAVVLLMFGAAVYSIVSLSMVRQAEGTLSKTAGDILLASQSPDALAFTLRALDLTTNVYVQVWDNHFGLRNQSANVPEFGQAFDPDQLQDHVRTFSTVKLNGSHLRVLTVPVWTGNDEQLVGYLQLATSLAPVDQAQRLLLIVLIGGGLSSLIIAGLVGWTTGGAALRPLDRVTETALQITRADDLSRRIPVVGPAKDEAGRLISAFNETLERLERLFEIQRRFLADVSHELRTPLTAIRGNLDLLRRLSPVDMESMEAIDSEVERMTRLVNDLLILAQAESGRLPLAHDVVELDTLLLDVYKEGKTLAQGKVDLRIGREDQARVMGDRDRLKQVLLNILSNAIQYTPRGGQVDIGLTQVGEWARLTVTDTGPGIDAGDLPHVFERFYRADSSRQRSKGGGAGLGLSIAYWITRSHGGNLEVASEPGSGTTFSIWLPRAVDQEGGQHMAHAGTSPSAATNGGEASASLPTTPKEGSARPA